jgi:hypothetical protein
MATEIVTSKALTAIVEEVLNQLQTGTNLVTVNGRKAGVTSGVYDQVLSMAAGSTTNITVTPPVGELWRVKMLSFYLPNPTGATSGGHRLLISMGAAGTAYASIDFSIPYNTVLILYQNIIHASNSAVATSMRPYDEITQMAAITNIVVSPICPLTFMYVNSTNAAQTGTAIIRIIKEVEYIA